MKNQNSWYCTIVLNVVMVIAGISVTHPITCLNPVTPVIQRIYNLTYYERYGESMPDETWTILLSFTMSVITISAFICSLIVKPLVVRFTKIRILFVSHIINITGCIIIVVGAYAHGSYEAFIAGRFVIGLSVGLFLNANAIWINEICVPHRRTLYAGLLGTWYLIGAVFGILMGWPKILGTDDLWLGAILSGMAVSVIFLACAYWIPDTPLEIMKFKGPEAARDILRRLRTEHGGAFESEMQTLSGEDDEFTRKGDGDNTATAGFVEIMKTPQYRKHFFSAVIIFSNITACGLSNILFFSDTIFLNAGLDSEIVTIGTIAVFVIGVIVSFCAIFVMEKLDPKTLALMGIVLVIVGDVLTTVSLVKKDEMSVVAIVATCIFYAGFSIINMTAYVLIAAICIERTRAVCMTFATMGFWFFMWFVGFISPYLDVALGPYAFMVWMGLSIAIGVYVYFCVPKIAGKSEETIQSFYKK